MAHSIHRQRATRLCASRIFRIVISGESVRQVLSRPWYPIINTERKCAENYNIWRNKFIFWTAISILVISNYNSFRVLFNKIASAYVIWRIYLYFSIGNGQPREPALCQLYRHTFVPYSNAWHSVTERMILGRTACIAYMRSIATDVERSVVCMCWSGRWALQKRPNRSRCRWGRLLWAQRTTR